jgi:DNA-binding CsgD family transcriptional regulator
MRRRKSPPADDTPSKPLQLERLSDRYALLYPSLPERLTQILGSADPAMRAKVMALASHLRRRDRRGGDLMGRYGLTEAQRAVALFIAGGGRVAEYARQNGVSAFTVRTHLKAIFAKTGVRRQADLVRLISPI